MYLQRKAGGVYYFRMSIPTRLTAVYGGRKESVFSLDTTDKMDAGLKAIRKCIYDERQYLIHSTNDIYAFKC